MQKLEISGIHIKPDERLKKYITRKLGSLDKYAPRHSRDSAHAEIKLKEHISKGKNESTCEMVLRLPQETLTIQETTQNMYAAVDIVEEKMKQQLKKYKSLHANPRLHQRAIARLRRRAV